MRVDRFRFPLLLMPFAMALLLSACGDDKKGDPGGPGGFGHMPPPEVGVVTVGRGRLTLASELPGRVEALRTAEVRARVSGIVKERVFREGSDVQAGQVLFRIDPAPFKATYDSATANVARAEAARDQAKAQADRAESLIGKKMISQQDYDLAVANARQTTAEVASAKAAQETARLNLGYATVTAPIAGRIGRAQVTEGALVGQGEATQMALIQQINPIYVNFSQSSVEVLKLRQALASGQLKSVGGQAQATLVLEDGSEYKHKGRLLFSDLAVDPSTGSVTLRAEFPNPEHVLLPGMYVRVHLEQGVVNDVITVPQRAVMRSAQGAAVMVVGADGKVAPQPVTTGAAQGDAWIVTGGLKGGEQVIVEGLQKAKPGMSVKPVPFGAVSAQQGATQAQGK